MARHFHACAVMSDLEKIVHRVRKGFPAFPTEVAAAANPLCFADERERPACWRIFAELAASALRRIGDQAAQSALDFFAGFLEQTADSDIAHLIRRDRHIWNMCLHVFRRDGNWVACDVVIDGVMFVGRRDDGFVPMEIGRHRDSERSEKMITADLKAGLGRISPVESSRVHVFFRNDRVLDVASSVIKLCAELESVTPSGRITAYFDKSVTFFDPQILAFEPVMRDAVHYDPRGDSLHKRARDSQHSVIEAIYLPKSGADSTKFCYQELYRAFLPCREAATTAVAEDEFVLFVSFELEKRVWVEQTDTLSQLIEILLNCHATVGIIVNGMTGSIYGGYADKFDKIRGIEAEIIRLWQVRFGDRVRVDHLSGLSLDRKISRAARAQFFVAPAGTAAVTALLAGIPGVCYSHRLLDETFKAQLRGFRNVAYVCGSSTTEARGVAGVHKYDWIAEDGQSYSIVPSQFLKEVLPILSFVAGRPLA
jgi:hypothetical protein